MRNTFIEQLRLEAIHRPDVLLLTGDLGFGVLNRYRETVPQQFLNVGIAEQNMIGVAAGLALEGFCVCTYSIGNFSSLRCLEQIRNDVCYANLNVKIISVGSGLGYGSLGMSHHATEDVSILRALPNMTIYSPADVAEAKAVAHACLQEPTPAYIRLARVSSNVTETRSVHVDGCNVVGQDHGHALLLLTHGSTLALAQSISERLPCDVYTVPMLNPLPETALLQILRRRTHVITLEEHNRIGGFGSAIGEFLSDHDCPQKLIRLGLPDHFMSTGGTAEQLCADAGLDCAHCIQTIERHLRQKVSSGEQN